MADVRPIIEGAVRAALGAVMTERIDVVFGHDHHDEEAFFVAIEIPPSTPRLGGKRLLSAMTAVNAALVAAGEPPVRLCPLPLSRRGSSR